MAFRDLGRAENGENRLSAMAETEKTPQIGFPSPWMSKKLKKLAFQPLEAER